METVFTCVYNRKNVLKIFSKTTESKELKFTWKISGIVQIALPPATIGEIVLHVFIWEKN
jgi:hypothetical protein